MKKLEFDFEWESPGGARGAELRATWARLQISVEGETVTRVEDRETRSTRSAVYGPLYPIAEWMATNWWSLLHEVASPERLSNGYWRRHSLAAASEGFSLPQLTFQPEGRRVLLKWEEKEQTAKPLNFLARGSSAIAREALEEALRSFVAAVVSRLEEAGVTGTFLQEEWKAVDDADADERAYCRLLGRLGEDPYASAEAESAEIVALAEELPPDFLEELLTAAGISQVVSLGRQLADFLARAKAVDVQLTKLQDLKKELSNKLPTTQAEGEVLPPWAQGYEAARLVRDILAPSMEFTIGDSHQLGELLTSGRDRWDASLEKMKLQGGAVHAVMAVTQSGAPYFAVHRHHETGKVFTLCRALCEYLISPGDSPALVSNAYSERQKRSRAFAAEFLAPAAHLRSHLGTVTFLSREDVQEIASELQISEFVIEHQVVNHGLATVQDLTHLY